MARWVYDISRHSLGEIISMMEAYGYDRQTTADQVLMCDQDGACFFDHSSDPYQKTIKEILDRQGAAGWELVQLAFREKEIIGFWKKQED